MNRLRESMTLKTVIVAAAIIIVMWVIIFTLIETAESQEIKINCLPLEQAVSFHTKEWGEERVAEAISNEGKLAFTFLLSPSGTFSLLVTTPQGCTKRLAAGADWRFQKPRVPGKDS